MLPRIPYKTWITPLRPVVVVAASLLGLPFAGGATAKAQERQPAATTARRVSITDFGAVGDGVTRNTEHIQAAIDQLAATGGGMLVIPKGTFLSGALFLKPGVNLSLEEGAVLKASADIRDYPRVQTRIEGHFTEWVPALLNADRTDHLRIGGAGTLDGSGAAYWREFLERHKTNRATTNLDVARPRLVLVQNANDVQIRGLIFKDSAFWNLHLYRCKDVVVENTRFEVPDRARCPSTDGTDVDSCQNVTIRGCTYRVDDDCIALKGSKGPLALADRDSPPTEHIRVSDCTFERGNGVLTLGSEATVVRDVVVERCRVAGSLKLACLKLRPDTPQDYEDIHFRDITLDSAGGMLLQVAPWRQYFALNGQPPPHSVVRNVTLSHIKGQFGAFGSVEGNRGQTEIRNIQLSDIDVQLRGEMLRGADVAALTFASVSVNGKPFALREAPSPAPLRQ